MNSRSNVSTIRSMQLDRGARIRTFRQLNRGDPDIQAKVPPHRGDANGERYTEALGRLTSFKARHKEQVWQDRRKAEWKEEDAHLQRESRELTKAIEAILSAATFQDCSADPIAPAWDGYVSTAGGSDDALKAERRTSTGKRMVPYTPRKNTDSREEKYCTNEPRHPQPDSPAPKELSDISAGTQELERARRSDLQADQCHVRELRALVAEFVLRGRGGGREGYMAELLIEARTAHRNAGTYLAERARTLEAEVDIAKRTVATCLAPDRAGRSSTFASVLARMGLGEIEERGSCAHGTGNNSEENQTWTISERQQEENDGLQFAMMHVDVSNRLRALEAEHDSRLQALRTEFLRDAGAATSAGSAEAALSTNGGWSAERHFRFMKVIKAAKRGTTGAVGSVLGGSSDSSAALKKRLKADLPEVSAHEVSRHESWYRLRGLHLAKRRAEKQRHARELEDLVTWGKKALETLRNEEKASAVRATEQEERERRRAELDDLLREQGQARERRNEEDRKREEKALQERISRETEEAERKVAEDERKRNAVAEYHASLRELRAREQEALEAAARAEEAERAQRLPINRERVGFRQDKARRKQEENLRREQEAKALEVKRLQVLEKLAASVPYAEACANAEAKLDHITAATAAHFDQFSPFERSRGHCPMFGYNTRKVFKDARFRLGLYLREAGVSGSASAHAAVMRAAGPVAAAPYGQTA